MQQWLKFFLVGVSETAQNSSSTFREILKLRDRIETRLIPSLGRRTKLAHDLMKELYKSPITTALEIAEKLDVTVATANRIISEFVQLEILSEMTGFKRNRLFVFHEYLKLFENRT